MTDSRAMVLHASSLGRVSRSYICRHPLELSDALAEEIARAYDPAPIKDWMEGNSFYDYWKACFEDTGDSLRDTARPRPCLYLDESGKDSLATVLTVRAVI